MTLDQKNLNPDTLQGQYAGFVSRFLAFLIDIIVVVIIVTVVGGIVSLLLNFFGLSELAANLQISDTSEGSILRWLAAFWGVTSIAFLYFVILWSVTAGKTVGKALMGVRIVPMNGERITLLVAIWRYVAFWFAVLVFALGVLWIIISDKRQGWHDKMAKTCVIYDWPAREDEGTLELIRGRWTYVRHTRRRLRDRRKKTPAEVEIESES